MKIIHICDILDKVRYPRLEDVIAFYPDGDIADQGATWRVTEDIPVDDDGVYVISRERQELLDRVLHGAQQELLDLS